MFPKQVLISHFTPKSNIEVCYKVVLEEKSTHFLDWWPATVLSSRYRINSQDDVLEATIRFQARHGHKATNENVTVQDKEWLRNADNVSLRWRRCHHSVSDNVQDAVGDVLSFIPDPSNAHIRNECKHNAGSSISEPTSSELEDFRRQLSHLQEQVIAMRRERLVARGLEAPAPSPYPPPLVLIASRVTDFLIRSPIYQRERIGTNSYLGDSVFSQHLLTKSADCSLLQFLAIARHISAIPGCSFDSQPDRDAFMKSPGGNITISFQDFANFARALGGLQIPDALNDIIISERTPSKPREHLLCRVLGTVTAQTADTSLPLLLHIGGSWGQLPFGQNSSILLRRESSQRHELELYRYLHPWTRSTNFTEFVAQCKDIQERTETDALDGMVFSLTWKREARSPTSNMFRDVIPPAYVFGKLQANIPYVIGRGDYVLSDLRDCTRDIVFTI